VRTVLSMDGSLPRNISERYLKAARSIVAVLPRFSGEREVVVVVYRAERRCVHVKDVHNSLSFRCAILFFRYVKLVIRWEMARSD
jgi:hypothetical protein